MSVAEQIGDNIKDPAARLAKIAISPEAAEEMSKILDNVKKNFKYLKLVSALCVPNLGLAVMLSIIAPPLLPGLGVAAAAVALGNVAIVAGKTTAKTVQDFKKLRAIAKTGMSG